jgi:hypothetical protein
VSESTLNVRRIEAARLQSLFREVNDRIAALAARFHDDEPELFVCECNNISCIESISIDHDDYRAIRLHPNQFVIAHGHEDLEVDEVVEETNRWLIVRKRGAGAEVALELAGTAKASA